jgi:Acetyltransferase (GNAT) domain
VSGAVRLRDVTEADLPVLFEQQLDPEAVRMANFPSRDRDAFFTHWQRILADETVGKKTILLDGTVAGNVVSWQTPGGAGDREVTGLEPTERLVGYWIGKEFWGRGVATRALREFLHLETARTASGARREAQPRLDPGPGEVWVHRCRQGRRRRRRRARDETGVIEYAL